MGGPGCKHHRPYVHAVNLVLSEKSQTKRLFRFPETLVQTAAGFYSYFKADSFMKKANEEFFRPRGLLCTVVNFNPREGSGLKYVDTSVTHSRLHVLNIHAIQIRESRHRAILRRCRPATTESHLRGRGRRTARQCTARVPSTSSRSRCQRCQTHDEAL
jgi:hypothetical protein